MDRTWFSDHFRSRAAIVFAAAAFFLAAGLSVYMLNLKREALAFHPRDYNYFIELAARMADPGLTNRYATNIEGYNLVGLQGIEGVRSIYQAIHSEYYRWVNVLLYTLIPDPLPLYIVFSLLFFAPLVYALRVRRWTNGLRWALTAFILLYVLFPGTFPAVTSDLRSRMLYTSAWALAVMAVYFDRPWLEKLVLLAFLPIIREDGILLGAIVTGLNFVRMRGKPGRWGQTLLFTFMLAAAAGAFAVFMAWGGYNRIDGQFNPLNVLAAAAASPGVWVLAFLGLAALAAGWAAARRQPRLAQPLLFWSVYSLVLALAALQLRRDFAGWYAYETSLGAVSAWRIYIKVMTWEQASLLFSALILPLFLLGTETRGAARRGAQVAAAALCAAFTLTTAITLPGQIATWRAQVAPARLVWDFKHSQDRYQTRLLVDFATFQAFYDVETVVVYNRLPVWMVYPNLEDRFYPRNKELTARAIAGGLEYAVIARDSLENVRELAQMAGRDLVEIQSNAKYLVLQFR